jgi:hypothetical protein
MKVLTETDLLVVSDTGSGLLGQKFFGVKENATLLLESSLSLQRLWKLLLPGYQPS